MSKALIIDDEDAVCRTIVYALSRSGIGVDIATSGEAGIRKFDQEQFDIVVTDIRMPGMDGNAVVHYIRNSNRRTTPVIGISGTAWQADTHQFDAVFEKPFSIHSFVDAVKRLTDCHPQARA